MGLVHPVVLASAMGYVDILRLLLEHVDAADENGDTAILYAARYGHPRCLQVLLRRGANIEHKNHAGDDLISLAIDSEDDTLLEITLQYYKKLRADKPMTRPPILIAAENGECEKIQTLLNMKLDPHATDEEGNTLLHLAAMNDEAEVIRRFHKQVNIDAVNAKGNTALHEACCRGHAASITALINNKATGSIGNYQGQTALHVAACCREIEPDTVKELMSYIMKSHAWESINIKDNEGKNALHLAAVHATPEVMWEFRHIPVKMADGDGNIALHKAARPGEPEALTMMLDIYETMKRDADINTQNNNHETVLHLVAKNGFSDHVERLVNFGADLSIQDQNGDTVCHTLTKLSAKYPNKAKVYVAVFEEILHEAAAWWCTKHNLHFPHGDQKMHEFYTRQAVTLLLTDIYNKENNNVLALACRVGAADILLLVLSQKEVLRFKHGDKMFYNVTNMTPLTSSHVGFSRGDAGDHTDRFSYIEWLVSKKNPIMACKVLNVQAVTKRGKLPVKLGLLAQRWGTKPAIIIMFTLYVVCKWDLQTMLGPAYVGRNVIYQMTGFAKEAMPVTISVLYSAAMLLKDIIKFLGIYTFVLLAFSFAIHAMFVTVAEASQKYPTPIHTMFTVFDLMIGMGNLFDGNLDTMDVPTYKMSYLKVVYVTYRVLATILLLNMVIAMMNDSYSAILHQHVLDWRLDSVKLGCTIEKAIPISTRIFSQIKFMKGLETRKPGEKPPEDAPDLPHALCSPDIWYIAIPLVRLTDQVVVEDEKDFEVLRTLNRKMGSMEHRFSADLQLLRHDVESLKDALVVSHYYYYYYYDDYYYYYYDYYYTDYYYCYDYCCCYRTAIKMSRTEKRRVSVAPTGAGSEDGDFVALRARREGQLEEPIIEEEEGETTPVATRGPEVSQGRPISGRTRDASSRLFDEAKTATPDGFQALLNAVQRLDIRSPSNNQNILHYLLHVGRVDLAYMVVERADVKLLLQDCDVTVASIHGKKNALHYVTELKDVKLAQIILSKVDDKAQKMKLLGQETPVEVEGQRPRTLPCCHLAAFIGCKDLVVLYLNEGVSVNALNSKKDTALLWAARWNHLDVVQELLSRNADTNVDNDKGSTALYWAVRYGHTDTVRLLLREGRADVNKTRKLGLVSPIVLACALGYLPIVKLLIENGADPNFVIRGRERPIHHAAKEGHSEIVEYLLSKGALIDEADEGGDTALLHAARYGHARCLQVLLDRGANHAHKNHMGDDLMSLAVESDNSKILKIALRFVKKLQADTPTTRSPLLLAAAAGECDKIQTLISMGLDPTDTDDEGNTMLHRAAMENQSDVILKFHSKIKIDAQNGKGNTALHEACIRGHAESISALIGNKATASIRNNRGETALHVAAYCRTIQPDTVKRLMDYVIKSHAWESLNIKDNEGNNALHLAAKFARPEVMWEFRHVPFKVKDTEGNIALHEAVRKDEPEALTMMLDIYEAMKRDADINDQNNNQETVLHLAAKEGFREHVNRLVLFGADLSKQDMRGNTVFHTLTQLSADYPHKAKIYLGVFEEILEQAALWWCMQEQLQYPHGDQTTYDVYTRQAVLELLTETYNKADLNVIGLACQVGAADIMQFILSKREVLCFNHDGEVLYNVTNMTPLTNNSATGWCPGGAVVPRPSYIEWLLSLENAEMASKVLDVQPFRDIEDAYSVVAAWTYAIIMVIHIVYMSMFSYSGIKVLEGRRKNEVDEEHSTAEILLYTFVPLEPAIILLYNLYRLAKGSCAGDVSKNVIHKSFRKGMWRLLNRALPVLLGIVYALLVIAWVVTYSLDYKDMDYFLSVAVCLGWLYTVTFTRGFRLIHYFWRMIQNMIIKDILKFLFIYLFVLLAFSFAIHAVFQISSAQADVYATPFDTMFLVFNLMIGMGELFDDNLDTNMSAVNRNTVYLKVVYLIYMVLATILLLNMLIAMMNDSYSAILRQHGVDWRLESVQLGVDIEKAFPWSTSIFSRIKFRKGSQQDHKKRKSHLKDEANAAEETELDALREVRLKMASMEQRLGSDLQQVKHDLDDLRALLRDLTSTQKSSSSSAR
nr:hypothetical protein BaRGS_024798 [Batillaria attramentaria]